MTKLVNFIKNYAKMHAALIGGAVSFLTLHYGGSWWLPMVTLGATALGVGAIPNASSSNSTTNTNLTDTKT